MPRRPRVPFAFPTLAYPTPHPSRARRYVTCVDETIFPPLRDYDYTQANLQWQMASENDLYRNKKQGPAFKVRGLGKNSGLTVRRQPNDQGHFAPQLNLSGLKYPSGASPNSLGLPTHVETEDDVLHIRELPSFDDALGQARRDARSPPRIRPRV